jgi:o-succinylbenzoate synthase
VIHARRLIEHSFPLDPPPRSAAGSWQERHSLLLVLEDGAGNTGLGEAAPLPGFSADALDGAHAALSSLLGRALPPHDPARDVTDALSAASAGVKSPAARAALEAALLDIWARQSARPAWQLLRRDSDGPARAVSLAVWLPDGAEAALAAARSAARRGVGAFKVKLDARRGLEDGVRTLEALRGTLGAAVSLRADANRSATRRELEPYVERLRAVALEWLEEPTSEPLTEALGVPIALDESLEPDLARPDFAARPFVAALVLKPTALGGIARCLELGRDAQNRGRVACASHTLEGPLGFMTTAALAVALGPKCAHGLGPHPALRGTRPPALATERDEIVPWRAQGYGLELSDALRDALVTREQRA